MSAPATDLDLRTDPSVQERYWSFQRWAWIAMALLTLAALAGLTGGGGPLSKATAQSGGAAVDYPRIARRQRGEQIVVTLPPGDRAQSRLLVGTGLTEAVSISAIHPQPREARATPHGMLLTFDRTAGESGTVNIAIRPERPVGAVVADMRVDDGPLLRLAMVVLP